MLSLGRKEGETIMIGDEIMVKVIKCGESVRIGIAAPNQYAIVRGELYEKEHAQGKPAGHSASPRP